MSDWMFDVGSATSLLSQDYGVGSPPAADDEPPPQSAPSEDPLYTEDLPDGGEVDPIVVTGPGTQTGGGTSGGGDFNWETDTTWLDPNAPEDLPTCTPPPDGRVPNGVDIDDLRDTAADLARELYNETSNDPNRPEYAAFIYMMPDGSLHSTDPFETFRPGEDGGEVDITLGRGTVPDGARIVAWVHSHPEGGNARQNAISDRDVQVLNAIARVEPGSAQSQSYGWSGDPDVMAYIVEVGGVGDGDISEYHESDFADRRGTVLGGCYGG